MFSKISRYRKLASVSALDARGRTISSTGLRLLRPVTGTFLHAVDAGDRLDQLAYSYYGQPLQWWNICDANPQFLSPFTLLGQDSIVTTRFPVTASGTPDWNALLSAVRALLGVENASLDETSRLVPTPVVVAGQTITVQTEVFMHAILATYNNLNISSAAIAGGIERAGFQVAPFTDLDQLGQSIVIPPKPAG